MRKLWLSKNIYVTSRFTFLINDAIGITSQLCPHTSELGLIIQNSGLDAWPLWPANRSCGYGMVLRPPSRPTPSIPLPPKEFLSLPDSCSPSCPPFPEVSFLPVSYSPRCEMVFSLLLPVLALRQEALKSTPAFALTCLSHRTLHWGMLCLSALLIISIWHCVCFTVFTSAPTLLPFKDVDF